MHEAVAARLRRTHRAGVSPLTLTRINDPNLLHTYLQGDRDVHGSHGLFYWLRARGAGVVVSRRDAAVVLAARHDVSRLVALRPVGPLDAVAELLNACAAAAIERSGLPLVVRYCSPDLADRLRARGWGPLRRPWQPHAPADDETFPEVVVTAARDEVPTGQRYKPLRNAIWMHAGRFTYRSSPVPQGRSTATALVERLAARSGDYDGHERGFNAAVLASLHAVRHDLLTYHYLSGRRGQLAAFAVTANVTGIAHGYYLAAIDLPRLAAYFLWCIHLQQRRSGAAALNLGGSESSSLHQFKTRTFPDHELQRTYALQPPASIGAVP